jgi:hypothetical protein
MKKVVRIKESELVNLIDKIITETTRKQKISEGVRNLAGKQIIKEEKDENITPELDNRIIKKTEELYKKNGGKTKSDFDKYYDMTIKEFGYDPKSYKDYMKKYFTPFNDEEDFY